MIDGIGLETCHRTYETHDENAQNLKTLRQLQSQRFSFWVKPCWGTSAL
jgi:hypothetical protein